MKFINYEITKFNNSNYLKFKINIELHTPAENLCFYCD